MRTLGINAVFDEPAAALVVDGEIVAAAEEERFSRRKRGKSAEPFATWEVPTEAALWCLSKAGLTPADLDAVAYSYDPWLMTEQFSGTAGLDGDWEDLRTLYAQRAPRFLASALPGLDPDTVRFVRRHVAHAASAVLASPYSHSAVLVVDGRAELTSMLSGEVLDGKLDLLATQELPHSLGLMYESLTEHLGFPRFGGGNKVMAMASYGTPLFAEAIRKKVYVTGDGGFRTEPMDWNDFAPPRTGGLDPVHADLAASVQLVLEEVLLDLVRWLRGQSDCDNLCLAGSVALNCAANSAIHNAGLFENVWVQPAAGNSGTALGAALAIAAESGEQITPMATVKLGRRWTDSQIAEALDSAAVVYERPTDLAAVVGDALADNQLVAWFQGSAEFGPRALGGRSLLADPSDVGNLERINAVKGREPFRPVAPLVLADRAAEVFSDGPLPSPYMLFTHTVAPRWRELIPAVTQVDGTARIQTVDTDQPRLHATLRRFEERTGVPVLANTSFTTAGRPLVDSPRDAFECFGSAPIDMLVIGPFVVRRPSATT